MNLSIVTKNHAADPETGFLTKSISKSFGCATAMPTALELRSHCGERLLKSNGSFFNSALFLITIFAPSKFSPEF